jgi:hypothetical protein
MNKITETLLPCRLTVLIMLPLPRDLSINIHWWIGVSSLRLKRVLEDADCIMGVERLSEEGNSASQLTSVIF